MKFSQLSHDVQLRFLSRLRPRTFRALARCSQMVRSQCLAITSSLCRRGRGERALKLWADPDNDPVRASHSCPQSGELTDHVGIIHLLPTPVFGCLGITFLERRVHPELFYMLCKTSRLEVIAALFPSHDDQRRPTSRGVRPRYRHLHAAVRAGAPDALLTMVSMPTFRWSRTTRRQLYRDALALSPNSGCASLMEEKGWINVARANYLVLFAASKRDLPYDHDPESEGLLLKREWLMHKIRELLDSEWRKDNNGMFMGTRVGQTKIREVLLHMFILDGAKTLDLAKRIHETVGLFPEDASIALCQRGTACISYQPRYEHRFSLTELLRRTSRRSDGVWTF